MYSVPHSTYANGGGGAGSMHLVTGQHPFTAAAPVAAAAHASAAAAVAAAAFHPTSSNVPSVISAVSDIHKRDKELIYG